MFLEKNLAALAQKPVHQGLVELMATYTIQEPEKISVFSTQADDLTLVWEDKAVHSLLNAQQEARDLVEAHLNKNLKGQTLLIGLGLGYLLKAGLETLEQRNSSGSLLIYETHLDLLAFVLQNVDLSEYLAHPQCYLFHDESLFVQALMGKYVQGDGLGIMYTPGYAQLLDDTFKDLLERIHKLLDNNKLNTFLLQERSKDWAEHFVRNVAYFPDCRPVDCWSQLFSGKTLVLVSAGPSLDEQAAALKDIQDSVIVLAVSGAVRPLLKHGVKPDFIMFMDSVGPSKHLKGLEDQLADVHFIAGPSAETFCHETPHRGFWLAAQHFNEQFSYLLDALYERVCFRYHTGGTVSMLAFQVALEMGFSRFIFIGQDLALRGNTIYAGGQQGQIDAATGRITMPESETSVARDIELTQVKGQDGSLLWTQVDYAHFLMHFETVARLIHRDLPDMELYNCSIGGAYMEGYEHMPLAELAQRLPLENLDKETIYQEAQERATLWQTQALVEGARQQLDALQDEVRDCLGLARDAIRVLDKMIQQNPEQWHQPSIRYSSLFNTFSEKLETHPFLHDTYFHEQLALRHHYVDNPDTPQQIRDNLRLDRKYLEHLCEQFEGTLFSWIDAARALLNERYPSTNVFVVQTGQSVSSLNLPV